jgi:hypothetical protein
MFERKNWPSIRSPPGGGLPVRVQVSVDFRHALKPPEVREVNTPKQIWGFERQRASDLPTKLINPTGSLRPSPGLAPKCWPVGSKRPPENCASRFLDRFNLDMAR